MSINKSPGKKQQQSRPFELFGILRSWKPSKCTESWTLSSDSWSSDLGLSHDVGCEGSSEGLRGRSVCFRDLTRSRDPGKLYDFKISEFISLSFSDINSCWKVPKYNFLLKSLWNETVVLFFSAGLWDSVQFLEVFDDLRTAHEKTGLCTCGSLASFESTKDIKRHWLGAV